MKNTFFLFILCAFIINCNQSTKNAGINVYEKKDNNYSQDEKNISEIKTKNESTKRELILINGNQILDDAYLKGGFWSINGDEYDLYPCLLRFDSDRYYFVPSGPPFEPWVEGHYSVIENKVVLVPEGIAYDFVDEILKETWELYYTIIENSVHYTEGLIGKGIIFGRDKSRVKNGEIKNVNGHEIVIERYDEWFKVNSNVKVRTGPGINYEYYIFELYAGHPEMDYLPEGNSIVIIGRTNYLDTQNGLTGYWYYCTIVAGFEEFNIVKPKKGNYGYWIFGPSIDF